MSFKKDLLHFAIILIICFIILAISTFVKSNHPEYATLMNFTAVVVGAVMIRRVWRSIER